MCMEHWNELKSAIENKGLGHLVSKDSQSVANRIKKELNHEHFIKDPLFSANMAIMGNAIQAGGLYLMGKKEDGSDYCPLCEALRNLEDGMDKKWIECAVQEQYDNALNAGLLNLN